MIAAHGGNPGVLDPAFKQRVDQSMRITQIAPADIVEAGDGEPPRADR